MEMTTMDRFDKLRKELSKPWIERKLNEIYESIKNISIRTLKSLSNIKN